MLAKSLSFLAGADAAGIVLGARVPIILTSRADSLIDAARVVRGRGARRRRHAARTQNCWGEVMADVILVLNAGSSSIKFSVFDAANDARAATARPDRGPLYGAALHRRRRAGRERRRDSLGTGRRTGSRRRDLLSDRLPAQSSRGSPARGGRPSRRAWRRELHPGGARHARGRRRTRHAECRLRRCTSRTTSSQSRSWRSCARTCRRSPASTPRFTASSRRSRRRSRCRASITAARRAALRVSRPFLRIHRQRARPVRPEGRGGAHDRRAPRQWQQHVRDGGWTERGEHDGLHRASTACRWARAAAVSIPA